MKQNFFQRLGKGLKYAFGVYGYGYDATKNSRYREQKKLYGGVQSEDRELPMGDRLSLITLLLDQKRNNPVVKSLCRLREEDTIGSGIMPRPQTGDEGVDRELVQMWNEYSDDCEVSGMSMMDTQKLLSSMPMIHGDGGLVCIDDGRVQLIAGEQIGTGDTASDIVDTMNDPLIVEGVKINESGMPVGYFVGSRSSGSLEDVQLIDAKHFIHHTKRMRAGQLRGVPELATAVDALMDVQEYEQTEMLSAKVSAMLAATVKRENSLDFEIGDRTEDNDRLSFFEPGQFHYLEPGESVDVISSNGRPNVNGIEWLKYKLRVVGSTVGVPVEFLLMTIGETSFSASQGMVLLYQNTIEAEQRQVIQTLRKWWRHKINTLIATGEMNFSETVDPYSVHWQPQGFRWINRSSQVQADSNYLQMGAISLENITSQFGTNPETVFLNKAKEIQKAKEVAEAHGLDHWRDLFNPITTFGNWSYDKEIENDLVDENPIDNE
jgi:lambda family phage portal protein